MGRLFWKFFLCILLAQVAATIGIGGAFWLRDRARSQASELDTGPPAYIALDAAAATLKHGGLKALRDMLGELHRPQVFVQDSQGRELLGRMVPAELEAEVRRQLASGEPRRGIRQLRGPDGERYTAFVRRQFRGAPPVGASAAPVGLDGPDQPARGPGHGSGRRLGQVAGIVAATLASLLFAALLAWYFSRPIRALRSAFEAASTGDLAPRFATPGRAGDELSDLGRDFDRMSARLAALMDGQRRLLHDVSHELRSPLARLQAAVGLAHQQPDKIGSSLERIERESMRMDKLVGELLALSRLEAATSPLRREPLDLAEMADDIAADARYEAGLEAPSISVEAPGPVLVHGDPDLLCSALENVVRNAVRHGGGSVRIVLHLAPQWAHLDVLDRGPGIAPADLGSIFQPFFRAHPNKVDGHGLGLAIARHVLAAHGGSISASNREDGGLQVRLSLPLDA